MHTVAYGRQSEASWACCGEHGRRIGHQASISAPSRGCAQRRRSCRSSAQHGAVDNKVGGVFDPVTEADRGPEQAMRPLIGERYPDHGILGEEFGSENGRAEYVWVLDPIDGTRAFISGSRSGAR